MQTSQHQVMYRRLVFGFVTLRVPIADLNKDAGVETETKKKGGETLHAVSRGERKRERGNGKCATTLLPLLLP